MNVKNNIIHSDFLDVWNNESNEGTGVDFHSHIHEEHEIIYVFSGNVEFYLEGYKYPFLSESLFLVPSNSFHGWKPLSSRLYHRVSICFKDALFSKAEQKLFLKPFTDGPRFFPNTTCRDINFYIRALVDCKDMDPSLRDITLKGRLISLLSEIIRLPSGNASEQTPKDKRILMILKHLEEHITDDLSLEDLAKDFSISKNYLNILFRQTTGTTVSNYIRIKRLGLARQEIVQGVKAQEAAYKAGFNDYSNFFRAYKAYYGSLPSAPGKTQPQEELNKD